MFFICNRLHFLPDRNSEDDFPMIPYQNPNFVRLNKPAFQTHFKHDQRLNTNSARRRLPDCAEHGLWLCAVAPRRRTISVACVLNFEQHPCNFLLAGQTRSWGKCLSIITISSSISPCLLSATGAECASQDCGEMGRGVGVWWWWGGGESQPWTIAASGLLGAPSFHYLQHLLLSGLIAFINLVSTQTWRAANRLMGRVPLTYLVSHHL